MRVNVDFALETRRKGKQNQSAPTAFGFACAFALLVVLWLVLSPAKAFPATGCVIACCVAKSLLFLLLAITFSIHIHFHLLCVLLKVILSYSDSYSDSVLGFGVLVGVLALFWGDESTLSSSAASATQSPFGHRQQHFAFRQFNSSL